MTAGRDHPDYAALDLPEDTPKEEWQWQHRRSYIYRKLMDVGHHGLLNKTELARTFDVTRPTIYQDLDRIAEFVEQNLGEDHASETVAVFQKAVKELLDRGDYKEAAKVQNMMGDWLERRGEIDKEPDKIVQETREVEDEDDFKFLDEVF